MSIYITGDMHGASGLHKLLPEEFPDDSMTREDYIIVCGDFGIIWADSETEEEREAKEMIKNRKWTLLFIDGNHENHVRLSQYPVEEWHGGKIHRISENIIHLMRGQMFDICGKKVFAMGGAASTDRLFRTEGVSWWPEEMPSKKERKQAEKILKANNWTADIILTHTAPTFILKELNAYYRIDNYTDWLEKTAGKMKFEQWYFGHFHADRTFSDTRFTMCFNDMNVVR